MSRETAETINKWREQAAGWEDAYQRFRVTESRLLRLSAAAHRMLDALEALESWDESLGSRSISSELWLARDELKTAVRA
jgi:hypothetical protein